MTFLKFSKAYKPTKRVKNMINVSLSYQKASFATPGGAVIPMPESSRVYSACDVLPDSAVLDAVESYANLLRHTESEVLFSEFLLTHLNNNFFMHTYPRGMFIDEKEHVKELVRENIPEDVKGQYWNINRGRGVSYVPNKEFGSNMADRITILMNDADNLEHKLSIQEELSEIGPTPMDPQEYDAISEDLTNYSVEEVIGRWSEDAVNAVLYSDEEL